MEKTTAVGIVAHVDAGKTTLSEEILYRCGVVRSLGRVDDKNAFLDHSEIERRRGVTVFSDQAPLKIDGRDFTLVDTPGHADFSGETERALSVLDCAVLVVSAAEGVQAHTEVLWGLLKERNVPTFIFMNKLDRAGADKDRVMGELARLGGTFCIMDSFSQTGEISSDAREILAELDDGLLEAYLSGDSDDELRMDKTKELIAKRKVFPVFCGAALRGEGVDGLLKGLKEFAPEPAGSRDGQFSGLVYKVRREKGGRVVYLRVEQGVLRPRDMIDVAGGQEKCSEIRVAAGARYEPVQEAGPGTLCAVTGLQIPKAGDRVGLNAGEASERFALKPLLSSKVLFDEEKTPPQVMLSRFRELEDEEPLLSVTWSSQLKELQVQVMGELQLEVLQDTVLRRWGEEVSFAPCSVLYRETLAEPVIGVGHFEPLRHYAEVHLRLEPAERGGGVTFKSECHQDFLAQNWQNLIGTHVLEKEHKGVLTGSPLTDVTVVLLSGRDHLKHTEGGDFREATYRAIRQGLMSGKSILLEPYYEFRAEAAMDEIGKIQGDLLRMEAECGAPWEENGRMCITGRGPVRTLMAYPREFSALTRGRGRLTLRFGGYEPCRDQERIVEEIGYEPERDVENTGDSVFCSHGAGYPVKWDEAPSHMHLPLETI